MSVRQRGLGLRRKWAADAAGLLAADVAQKLSEVLGRPISKEAVYDMWAGRALGPETIAAYAQVVQSSPELLEVPVPEAEQPPIQRHRRKRAPVSRVEKPDRGGLPVEQIVQILLEVERRMRAQGLNQREFAQKIDVHWTTLGDYFRSARAGQGRLPTPERLAVMAAALGTTLPELVAGPPPENGATNGAAEPPAPTPGLSPLTASSPIELLRLSIGADHLLTRAGLTRLTTVGELTRQSVPTLLREFQLSAVQVKEVQSRLAEHGLQLAPAPRAPEEAAEEEKTTIMVTAMPAAAAVPPTPIPPERVERLEQIAVEAEPEEAVLELSVPELARVQLLPLPAAPVDPFAGELYQEVEGLILILGEQADELVKAGRNMLKWLALSAHTMSQETMVAAITRCHEEALALIIDVRLMRAEGKFPPRLGAHLERCLLAVAEKLRELGVDRADALEETLQ